MTVEIPQEGQEDPNDSLRLRSLEEAVRGVLEHHDGLCLDDEHDRQLLLAAIVEVIKTKQQATTGDTENSNLGAIETVNPVDVPSTNSACRASSGFQRRQFHISQATAMVMLMSMGSTM
jgi:hypothetical protein